MSLQELKNEILADGIIDAEEAARIKTLIYEDGKIDKDEADFLFELNDATSGKENSPEWKNIFVEGISDYVLGDDNSPNEIDEEEAKYLLEKMEGDGQYDENEKALLTNLKLKASKIDSSLGNVIANLGL